jgi:hypothetical protein
MSAAISGVFALSIPHIAALMRATRYYSPNRVAVLKAVRDCIAALTHEFMANGK